MKRHQKEIDNDMLLYENFLKKDYFHIAVNEKEKYFKLKYPDCDVVKRSNKHGVRIIVYEKRTF